MTESELSAIEARASAATQGPWHAECETEDVCDHDDNDKEINRRKITHWRGIYGEDGVGLNKGTEVELFGEADADFIAHSRAAVPTLCAALRRAWANEARLAEALVKMQQHYQVAAGSAYGHSAIGRMIEAALGGDIGDGK